MHAVVLDVGHVLVDWDIRYLYEKLIADPVELDWFLSHVTTPAWHFAHDAGRSTAETIPELAARFPDHAGLIALYAPRWLETIGRPVPGMFELAHVLHQRGVPLFAITNFSHEFWPRFAAAYPVTQLFRDVVVSGTEKVMKPHPDIYRIALQRFGLEPHTALFADDRLDNVEAAERNGFVGHHFRSSALLRGVLESHGLLPAAA